MPRSLGEIWWLVAAGIRVRKARLLNAFVAAGIGNSGHWVTLLGKWRHNHRFFCAHEQIIVRVRVHHYHVWSYGTCCSHHYEVEHDKTKSSLSNVKTFHNLRQATPNNSHEYLQQLIVIPRFFFLNWIISKEYSKTYFPRNKAPKKEISTPQKTPLVSTKAAASHISPMDKPPHALKRFEPRWFGRNQYQRTEQGIQHQYRAGNPQIWSWETKNWRTA